MPPVAGRKAVINTGTCGVLQFSVICLKLHTDIPLARLTIYVRSNFWMTKFKNIVGKQVGITKNISKIHVDFQEITGNMKIYFQKSPLVLKFSQIYIYV